MSTYNANGSYNFQGVEFDNLFRTDSTNFQELEGDQTIQEILDLKEQKKNRTTFLPAILRLTYIGDSIISKVGLEVSVQQIVSKVYTPKSTVKLFYPFRPNTKLMATVSYGGFGYINYGIGLSGQLLKKKLLYRAEIYYFEALISPDKTSGQAANLGIAYKF